MSGAVHARRVAAKDLLGGCDAAENARLQARVEDLERQLARQDETHRDFTGGLHKEIQRLQHVCGELTCALVMYGVDPNAVHQIAQEHMRRGPAASILPASTLDIPAAAAVPAGTSTATNSTSSGTPPRSRLGSARRRRAPTTDSSTNTEITMSISGVGPSLRSGHDMRVSSRPFTAAGCEQQPDMDMPRRPSWFENAPTTAASLEDFIVAQPQLGAAPLQLGVVPVVPNAAVPRAAMQSASSGTPPSQHRLPSKRRPRHLAALEDSGGTPEPSRIVPQSRQPPS